MAARARRAVAIAVVVLTTASRAAADPDPPTPAPPSMHLHVNGPSTLSYKCSPGPCLRRDLPPAHVVDDATWSRLDVEMRRLQDAETRLGAENGSLRQSVGGWQPGWKTLAVATLTGAALGIYAYSKF